MKILCTGDVEGKFSTLFKTVSKLNQKAGPFAALLCVGCFFDREGHQDDLVPYLEGKSLVPIPTYFITGNEDDAKGCTSLIDEIPDGGELCKNLTFLGRQGVKRLPCGLTVAYLSGAYNPAKYNDSAVFHRRSSKTFQPHYLAEDIDAVVREATTGDEERSLTGVDVLMTSEWGERFDTLLPEEMSKGSDTHPLAAATTDNLSPAVSRLASEIAARYHLAGTEGVHFQMSPYRNPLHATRFYGLGTVGNPKKIKSTVALAVTPTAALALAAAEVGTDERAGAGVTICPYTAKPKPAAGATTTTTGVGGPSARPAAANQPELKHEELPGGEWKCALCDNVNRAHQNERCNMKRCGAPRHGSLEMFQLQNMSFRARGAKRDADGAIVQSMGIGGGGGDGRVYSMMSREQAEEAAAAAAAAAAEEAAAAGGGGGGNKQQKTERPSLYAAQKPMSAKQKYRKGTSNPGAWR